MGFSKAVLRLRVHAFGPRGALCFWICEDAYLTELCQRRNEPSCKRQYRRGDYFGQKLSQWGSFKKPAPAPRSRRNEHVGTRVPVLIVQCLSSCAPSSKLLVAMPTIDPNPEVEILQAALAPAPSPSMVLHAWDLGGRCWLSREPSVFAKHLTKPPVQQKSKRRLMKLSV